VPDIVRLLADDLLGAARESLEDPLPQPYWNAFDAIDADPGELLVVGVDDGRVVATAQVSFLPGLSRRGALRAQLEAVRVDSSVRGRRIGESLVAWVVDRAHERGADVVQLTSDRSRVDAHRFYERLGFQTTHVGMKRSLTD
jgi:GNAT superfamily N-acetyltransferase